MPTKIPYLTRRRFLASSGAAALAAGSSLAMPAIDSSSFKKAPKEKRQDQDSFGF